MPPRRHALRLAGILCLFLVPVLARLGDSDVRYHMEVMSVLPAQESWLRHHDGEAGAWLKPTLYGEPRLRKPPMLYWVTGLSWWGLTPESASTDQLMRRARLGTVAIAGLGIVSIYALGLVMGGGGVAWISALALAVMLVTLRQCRMAVYDTQLFGWCVTAASLGIVALRARSGWGAGAAAVAGGLCLGAGLLTKGPIALLFVTVPIGAAWWQWRPERGRAVLPAAGLLAVGLVLAGAWFVYIWRAYPEAASVLGAEYDAGRLKAQPPWYYLGLIGLVFPWSLTLLATLAAAGKRLELGRQPGFRTALIWLVVVFTVMSIPGPKRQRYIFPLVPAVALLIGFWWDALARGDLPERWQRGFLRAHGWMMGAAAAVFAVWILVGPWLTRIGYRPGLPGITLWTGLPCALSVGALAWRLPAAPPPAAANRTALLMALMMTFGIWFYVDSHHGRYDDRATAEALGDRVPTLRVAQLTADDDDTLLDKKFLLYSRKLVTRLDRQAVLAARSAWVIARDQPHDGAWLAGHGWTDAGAFDEGTRHWRLWRAQGRMP